MIIKLIKRNLSVSTKGKLYAFEHRIMVLFASMKYLFKNGLRHPQIDYFDVPIIINNFNRLGFLKKLINSLERRGYTNIFIIDNGSTYPPLLDYYKSCPYPVYLLHKNVGYKAIWETGIYDQFKHSYYVYTDSDMQIDESCPRDFMEHFVKILQKYKTAQKVGFGIRIDDLPNSYPLKENVIEWESQFWKKEVQPGLYQAWVDTTFALYRPYCKGEANHCHKVFRTGAPYLIKHLPWYNLKDFQTEEEYYLSTIKTSTHWSSSTKE